jgi:hypothetical protein
LETALTGFTRWAIAVAEDVLIEGDACCRILNDEFRKLPPMSRAFHTERALSLALSLVCPECISHGTRAAPELVVGQPVRSWRSGDVGARLYTHDSIREVTAKSMLYRSYRQRAEISSWDDQRHRSMKRGDRKAKPRTTTKK